MRFRTGIVVGAAFGYVLGARAGRGRYEQIKGLVLQARKHPAVAQLADQSVGLVDAGRYAMAAGLSAGSRGLRALRAGTTQARKTLLVAFPAPTGTLPR